MPVGLEAGYLLDRLWHWMQGEGDRSKQPALLALARLMEESGVPYAVIGGVALQIHQREPRTTLDIYLAVAERSSIPRELLRAAGFRPTGSFEHSESWEGPESVPVQFTDDPALRDAVAGSAASHGSECDAFFGIPRLPRAALTHRPSDGRVGFSLPRTHRVSRGPLRPRARRRWTGPECSPDVLSLRIRGPCRTFAVSPSCRAGCGSTFLR